MNVIPTSGLTFKIDGKPAVTVLSVADAAAKWRQYRDETGEGVSVLGNGGIVRDGKRIVARVSYNGRIWDEPQRELRGMLALRAAKAVG